jgi:hypothetical protein
VLTAVRTSKITAIDAIFFMCGTTWRHCLLTVKATL